MKIAMLSPIARRTPPWQYGPREDLVSLLTEGLVSRGIDVTLFATGDSQTMGRLVSVCPAGYEEAPEIPPKAWECLHISEVFERGEQFDLIHNHCDYPPLTYMGMTTTPVLTTIHEVPSSDVLPVYKKYSGKAFYVAINDAYKRPEIDYIATVRHGIDLRRFAFRPDHGKYLLFPGPIHQESGARECIELARETGRKLVLTGFVKDRDYFDAQVRPHLDDDRIVYAGGAGPEQRNELFGGAVALLHPVDFGEPSGLSVVEAMACGTPVIAVNRGGMPEIIADGVTGFLVRDSDEMAGAVARVGQLDRFRCRQWVEERFSADRMVEEYIGIYEKVIRQTGREDHRPWGFYEILSDTPGHKVKRITVYAGQRLSYQRHFRRSEHWYVVTGKAVVTRNDEEIGLTSGQAVDVPVQTWHRIRNPGTENMVFIEVQTGDYFGEDDIERIEDDYGRV